MPVLEAVLTRLADVVLIVEDDSDIAESYQNELTDRSVQVEIARNEKDAIARLSEMRYAGFDRMVVLLDLMFAPQDPTDGLSLMRQICKFPEFRDGTLKVVVRTAIHDDQVRSQLHSFGASAFHVKGIDSKAALEDVLLHLGREVLVRSLLFEIVGVDRDAHEIDIRYSTDEGDSVRALLDLEYAPVGSRVTGGSFWFDFFKQIRNGAISTRSQARTVDLDQEREQLLEILGPDELHGDA